MNVQEIILQFRKQISDLSSPYLIDDEEALLYLIDAQDMFIRKMGGISDNGTTGAGTAISDVSLAVDEPTSDLSPYILRIRSGKLLTAQRNIQIIGEADLRDQLRIYDYGTAASPDFLKDTDTGSVTYGIIGLEDNKLRWYKVPDTADTCRLHVYRLPYPRLVEQEDDLEIPEQHHLHLIKWMKHWAYSKEDAEIYDKELSTRNEQAFMKYCDDAKSEYGRQRYKPRVVKSNW